MINRNLRQYIHCIKQNTIKEICLVDNKIGDFGAELLSAALQKNTSVTVIMLNNDNIGDAGAKSLAAGLQANSSLTKICLRGNHIGDVGVQALIAALQTNTSLELLDLQDNNIGDAGAKALATALLTNSSLGCLWLGKNTIGDAGAKALAGALQTNTSLIGLDLSSNYIGDAGANTLARALQANTSLTYLCLNRNNIDISCLLINCFTTRNILLAKMPYTTNSANKIRTSLLVSPFFSSRKPSTIVDPIEIEMSDIEKVCYALLNLRADINKWLEFAPDKDSIRNINDAYLANIAYAHLRCVTPRADTTPITNLNRNILAASLAVTAISKDHDLYKTLNLHLGMYYLSRTLELDQNDEDVKEMQQSFAKSALNHLNTLLQDNEFSKKDNVIGELPMLIAHLIHLVIPGKGDDFTLTIESINGSSNLDSMKLVNDPAWKAAISTTIANEIKPSDFAPTSETSTYTELRQTQDSATLDRFNRFLEELKESSINTRRVEGFTIFNSAFSIDSPRLALFDAINTFKAVCNGGHVDHDTLNKNLDEIKKSAHCHRISRFILLHKPCINGNRVSTFDELVITLTIKPSLSSLPGI